MEMKAVAVTLANKTGVKGAAPEEVKRIFSLSLLLCFFLYISISLFLSLCLSLSLFLSFSLPLLLSLSLPSFLSLCLALSLCVSLSVSLSFCFTFFLVLSIIYLFIYLSVSLLAIQKVVRISNYQFFSFFYEFYVRSHTAPQVLTPNGDATELGLYRYFGSCVKVID